MIQSYLMRLAGVLVASLPPFPQIWTDGQFTIHRKAIKIKQDFSISLQYGMARADIHLARLRPSPRYHLHDSLYLNCISQLVFQLHFSRVCFGVRSIDHLDAQKWLMEIIFKKLFFQCRVPRYGLFDTLNTKNLEKIILGGLFWPPPPPQIHYTALQCTVV